MRKISSVVSAAQVNNIDYQFKAARKYSPPLMVCIQLAEMAPIRS